jgi:hypothetical protein
MATSAPEFTHIHCSSRYDRSASVLETALDNWMANSTLVTLTEIQGPNRVGTLAEQGWGYYCVMNVGVRDSDCAICWKKSEWHAQNNWIRKLYGRFPGLDGRFLNDLWAATVLLKHATSGQTLLTTVAHMPAHVEGSPSQHWRQADQYWRARKQAYMDSMKTWSGFIRSLVRTRKPDAILVAADWNFDLKDNWFRDYMNQHWGDLGLKLAWKHFPSAGSMPAHSGPRIIDGSYFAGMSTQGAVLLPPTASSDHRPYLETFTLKAEAGAAIPAATRPVLQYDPVSGQTKPGIAWWGYGDYKYDEFYERVTRLADGSYQVTFDFDDDNVPYY